MAFASVKSHTLFFSPKIFSNLGQDTDIGDQPMTRRRLYELSLWMCMHLSMQLSQIKINILPI